MFRVFVHATNPTPYVLGHKGFWTWNLPDGTYLVAIGHDDHGHARAQVQNHPQVISVVPTRTSGNIITSALQTQVNNMLSNVQSAQKAANPLAPVANIVTGTTPQSTATMLQNIFQVTGDLAFHPEASL